MTKAMYDAIMEVAENGERFAARDLNVSARTMNAAHRAGYVANRVGGGLVVTAKGWAAVAA